ncbi:MAG: TIGR02757 family protein [Bacteroidia bacterium]|nr:TIGR02757 family protein [Bacteroidia bacterium]
MGCISLSELAARLERLHRTYHRLEYRKYDPVDLVWRYSAPTDQEIVGLWAALFAWGRREVAIQKIQALLMSMGSSPFLAVREGSPLSISWRHRTWSPTDINALWRVLHGLYERFGSLQAFFWPYRRAWEEGIAAFQEEILTEAPYLVRHIGYIRKGSTSKRIMLWLRWMVRRDTIDPGPWEGFSPRLLYVPVDTHVGYWARKYGLSDRKTPSWKLVKELTQAFLCFSPADPLRYDFSLVTAAALGKGELA